MSAIATKSTKPGVAHVVLGLQVGGLERVAVNLVGGLRDHFRPIVVCLEEGGGAFQPELEKLGIPVHVLGRQAAIDWNAVTRLVSIFRAEGMQIVHTHNPAPHFYGVMAALRASVPVRVHTKHGRNHPREKRRCG